MELTASGLERAVECPASRTLPKVSGGEPSDAARKGQVVHEYLCDISLLGPLAAMAKVPEEFRAFCRSIILEGLPVGPGFLPEVAFSYFPETDTAMVLGTNIGRAYPSDGGVHGTLDAFRALVARKGVVSDYKTGFGDGNVTPAARNWQLACLALMAARAYDLDFMRVELIHIHEDGTHHVDAAELGPMDLAATAEALAQVLEAKPSLDAREGSWCKWCSSFAHCPAKAKLAQSLMAMPELVLNDATVPRILDACDSAEKVLKQVKAAAREYVSHNPIRFPDGSVLAMQEVSRETIDAVKARDVLPADVWNEATEVKMTKAALTAAVKASNCGTPASVMKALREAGAVSAPTHLELRRVKPPKSAALPEGEGVSNGNA